LFQKLVWGAVSCRQAIVEELAGLGVSVYTCARSGEDVEKSLATWRAAGWNVEGCVCDVSDRQAREGLFSKVADHFGGKLDILVRMNYLGTYEFLVCSL
jgi:Tropinone reductase 1